ncbi:hypothetical protein ACNPNP_19785 [Microbacterium sp. AGC85]
MNIKFAMEAETLVRLGQRSATESEDLGTLVRSLVEAAEPLQGVFNGPARARFDNFKLNTDAIANGLNGALAGIVGAISGQNIAFNTAGEDGAAAHDAGQSSADFSSEATLARISGQSSA